MLQAKIQTLFTLALILAGGASAQGVYTGWQSNGNQYCQAVTVCQTPWATGSGNCLAPNVGPGGWRLIGGQVSQFEFCVAGYANAGINSNLPYSYYVGWYTNVYGTLGGLAQAYTATSACDSPTDQSGNYAANYGDLIVDYDTPDCYPAQ